MFRTRWLLLVMLVAIRAETKKIAKDNSVGANLRHVSCYSCSNCQRVFYNTTVKRCPYDPDYSKMYKCVTYVEKYENLDKAWLVRGCASDRGSCDEIRKAHEENGGVMSLSSCNECEGDKCNGVSHSLPLAFLTLVINPILAKLALS